MVESMTAYQPTSDPMPEEGAPPVHMSLRRAHDLDEALRLLAEDLEPVAVEREGEVVAVVSRPKTFDPLVGDAGNLTDIREDEEAETLKRFGLKEFPEEIERRFRAALALFAEHVISSGKAAEFAGISKPEFLLRASAAQVPVLDLDEEELAEEIRNA